MQRIEREGNIFDIDIHFFSEPSTDGIRNARDTQQFKSNDRKGYRGYFVILFIYLLADTRLLHCYATKYDSFNGIGYHMIIIHLS